MPLPSLTVKIGADTGSFNTAMETVARTLNDMEPKVQALGVSMMQMGDRLQDIGKKASVVSGAIAAVGAASFGVANATAGFGNEIDKTSRAIGLSTDAYQELAFAIGQVSDLTHQQFGVAMRQMQTRMGQAGDGAQAMVDAFAALGISQEDIASGTVTTEDAFNALTSRLQSASTDAEAMAIAAKVMGEEAAKLGPILRANGGDIDALRQTAQELGIVMGEDVVSQSAAFTDKMDEVHNQFLALRNAIGAELMPVLTETLIPALQEKVIPAVASLAESVGNAIQWFSDLPAPVQEAMSVIAGVLAVGGPVLLAIGTFSKALGMLTIATGPIGLLITAATLLTVAWVKWGDDIKAAVGGAVDWVTTSLQGIVDFITTLPERFAEIGSNMIQGLIDGIQNKWEELKAKVSEMANSLPNWAKDILGIHSPSRVFAEIGKNIVDGLALGLTENSETALRAMSDVAGTIQSALTSGFMSMIDGTKSVNDAFRDMARSIIAKLYEVLVVQKLVGAWDSASGTGSGLTGFLMRAIAPAFDGGGYTGGGSRSGGVDGRGGFPAILHPNETVIDHTRGQMPSGQSVTVIQNNTFGSGVSRAEIQSMLPRIVETTKAAVFDAQRRSVNGLGYA